MISSDPNDYRLLQSEKIRKIESYTSDQLDDVVRTASLQRASAVNNEGLEAQVKFLRVNCRWSMQTIIDAVENN